MAGSAPAGRKDPFGPVPEAKSGFGGNGCMPIEEGHLPWAVSLERNRWYRMQFKADWNFGFGTDLEIDYQDMGMLIEISLSAKR